MLHAARWKYTTEKESPKSHHLGTIPDSDYRYVNRFTRDDAYQLSDISSVFQRIGGCNFVTVADCKAGYWQIPVLEEDK